MFQSNLAGVELFSCVITFFWSIKFTNFLDAEHVDENALSIGPH